jgi:hypothetical protein
MLELGYKMRIDIAGNTVYEHSLHIITWNSSKWVKYSVANMNFMTIYNYL